MKIEFPVDQVAAFRNGEPCDESSVIIDIDIASLPSATREFLADHIEDGVYTGNPVDGGSAEAAGAAICAGAAREIEGNFRSFVANRRAMRALIQRKVQELEITLHATRRANGHLEFSPFCVIVRRGGVPVAGTASYKKIIPDEAVMGFEKSDMKDLPAVRLYFDWVAKENHRRELKARREAVADLERREIAQLQAEARNGQCS